MRITVWYEDSGLEEFDTTALITARALGAPDAMTDVAVRLVEGDGIWAKLSWYDSACSGSADDQLAPRRADCRTHLLSEDELARVRSCDMDGALALMGMMRASCGFPSRYDAIVPDEVR
ncbi:hypothetical protein [Atopobium sp. oral taxon 416]|uniref:hypothetical protein n=1 Tax=Atopobium sp. oral taxon 416 TaxID=712157 RepID=UPI001BABF559|nr:hypothetical protein [Atopobium sp. oral taxon 416]QUC04583.1 hypothetical protein J4859_06580 [Atopobium sp. oral taxon 416]